MGIRIESAARAENRCIVKVVHGTALHVFRNLGMLFTKDSIDSESTSSLATCKLGGRALLT